MVEVANLKTNLGGYTRLIYFLITTYLHNLDEDL